MTTNNAINLNISNIALLNTAQTFTAAQSSTPVAVTSTSNLTATNAALGNIFTTTLTQNTTLSNPTNLVSGTFYTWIITQGASAFTVAFGNLFYWPGGTAPTITTANGAIDTVTSLYNGSVLLSVFSQNFLV